MVLGNLWKTVEKMDEDRKNEVEKLNLIYPTQNFL